MDNLNSDEDLKQILDRYESKAKDLQKVFFLTVGFGLLFFFMVLLPYFSLKYDYYYLTKLNNINGNTSQVLNEMGVITNDSKNIQNGYRKLTDYYTDGSKNNTNYGSKLEAVRYVANQSGPSISDVIQGNLISTKLFTQCASYPIKSYQWSNCNQQANSYDFYNALRNKIAEQKHPINTTLAEISNLKYKIDKLTAAVDAMLTSTDINYNTKTVATNINGLIGSMNATISSLNNNLTKLLSNVYSSSSSKSIPTFRVTTPILENSITKLEDSRDNLLRVKNDVDKQWSKMNDYNQKLVARFEQFETPFIKFPVGFNEAIAAFPISLAIGFLASSLLLRQASQLRLYLENKIEKPTLPKGYEARSKISLLVPLVMDPSNYLGDRKLQIALFLLPSIIFAVAFYMIYYMWFVIKINDIFLAAADLNTYVYLSLYIVSLLFFIYGNYKIFDELSKYNKPMHSTPV